MEVVNKKIEALEKANETLSSEIKSKTGQSDIGKKDIETLLNKINSLESSVSTLSQSYDSLKTDITQNRDNIEELTTELFGTNTNTSFKEKFKRSEERKGPI